MSRLLQDFSSEAYGESAALRYNIFESRASGFAMRIAPKISAFYQQNTSGKTNRTLLDVACGTGQLSTYFLDLGFDVVGLDRSLHMLKYARVNNEVHVASGRAQFIESDANQFQLEQKFGLAVCTFNGLNHLKSIKQVKSSIASVHRALVPGGYFIFDINTLLGLKNVVETIGIEDTDEEIIVRKRIFDGERIILNASGCFLHKGKWIRYRETIFKIIIDTKELKQYMLDNGWAFVAYTAEDFITPVENPEMEQVAYVVARKK
jgi:SAM-dependent methyltransferase